MKSIWEANVENTVIRVENNWFSGEKLFINNELQDSQVNYFSMPRLSGHFKNEKGERILIKANIIQGFFRIDCIVFVDDKQEKKKKVI